MDSERSGEDPETLKAELRLALEQLAEVSAEASGESIAQVGTLTEQLLKMRNPIASIQSYEEQLRTAELGDEQRKMIDDILEHANQLDRQLNALLNLVSAQPSAVRSEVEIPKVVELARAQVETDLAEAGLGVECEYSGSLPMAQIESDLLRQIIVLLLERAIRISPAEASIRLVAEADERGWVSIAVSDEGPGIPAEDLAMVFQPGVSNVGDDIGLPQVKAHMDAIGGRVWVASEMGAGSMVTVLVPASEETDVERS